MHIGEFRNKASIDNAHILLLPTFDHDMHEFSDCAEELPADHGCVSDSDSSISGYYIS